MSRAVTARRHYATDHFSNTWVQDRTRRLFAGMSPIEQRLHHKRAEWSAAAAEWHAAWDTPDASHWDRMMDSLNAEIEDLEEQQRAERIAILEAA